MIQSVQDITGRFQDSHDFKTREIKCQTGSVYLLYIEDLILMDIVGRDIVAPLTESAGRISGRKEVKEILLTPSVGDIEDADKAAQYILAGFTVVYVSATRNALYCNTKKMVSRGIEKTEFEPTLRGSKEAFNELLSDNLGLIRKRIATTDLKVVDFALGTKSNTQAVLLYINGVASADLVKLVQDKLEGMKNDYVLSINYIAEELATEKTTLETSAFSEKPDTIVSRLFEGRVAVLINGNPFALTVPSFLIEALQSPDDYYTNRIESNFLRLLRYFSFLTALLLPGFYIALMTHHYSLIPTSLVFKLAVSRAGVPFPTIIEVILMQIFFELAREGGKRLPSQIGQSLTVVATLILGQTSVEAGVASQATVVIVGVYAICAFMNPRLNGTVSIWSVFINILSAAFGLHGFYIGFIVFAAHLSSLRSCGYPFLFPLGTVENFNYKNQDYFTRGFLKNISSNLFNRRK